MPLPTTAKRKHMHQRSIQCNAYLREDGLWDIDAQMSDVKSHVMDQNVEGRTVNAGEPFHDMHLRITLDKQLLIHEAHAVMAATPFKMCPNIAIAYKKLEGTRIGPGWNRKTRELFMGVNGCTHLFDMLKPMSTTAIQAIVPTLDENIQKMALPYVINSCHSWSESSQVVRDYFPKLYIAPISTETKDDAEEKSA